MVLREFYRYLAELDNMECSDDVQRISNIILRHFDELLPLGTALSQRSKEIIKFAQNEFLATDLAITVVDKSGSSTEFPIKRIGSIEIESFRGFSKKEIFDLDSSVVLLYGPNGSGKSSFCEALEFSLLGTIEEAEVKRFSSTSIYAKNLRTNKFAPPKLSAIDEYENLVPVTPNDEKYRFCFVEKNRIDDFSRLAAKLPAHQSKLIGTLFGLEGFDTFVKGFSSELDPKYIDLEGKKAHQLQEKQNSLLVDKQIVASEKIELLQLAKEEDETANNFQAGMAFSELVAYLGSEENPGQIHELEKATESKIPSKIGIKLSSLYEIDDLLCDNHAELKSSESELEAQRSQLSFRNLFNAVNELRLENPKTCPACLTPLQKVVANPYHRAEQGLAELAHLSEIEQKICDAKKAEHEFLLRLFRILKLALDFDISSNDNKFSKVINLPNSEDEAKAEWWLDLKMNSGIESSEWDNIIELVKQIELYDADIMNNEIKRTGQLEELKKLRRVKETVIRHDEARKKKVESIIKSKTAIARFESDNQELIAEAESEKTDIALNKRIVVAYKIFVDTLNKYRENLPSQLVADLGEKVKELYNGFNRADSASDFLADIRLPLSSGSKIEIAFASEPSHFYDALHLLSEGHIRCLGLSILLAKNIKQNCPFLIFDDPVNAIDDEHREGIRRTIFEDTLFTNKQIILTCHGEEFFKDVQNLLGAERSASTTTYAFLPHCGDNQIKVDSSPIPRNYVIAARRHYSNGEIRDALANSRRALEFLTSQTWRFVAKHGDGNLTLRFRDPKAKAELRNITEQLKSKIDKPDFSHCKKLELSSALSLLLGIDGNSQEWRYLNKGTHEEEDREEFSRSAVDTIVKALEVLDSIVRI